MSLKEETICKSDTFFGYGTHQVRVALYRGKGRMSCMVEWQVWEEMPWEGEKVGSQEITRPVWITRVGEFICGVISTHMHLCRCTCRCICIYKPMFTLMATSLKKRWSGTSLDGASRRYQMGESLWKKAQKWVNQKDKKWENWSEDLAAAEATRSRVMLRSWAARQTAQCCRGEFYLLIVFRLYCRHLNLE